MLPPALQSIADDLATWRARVLDEVAGLSQRQADWQPAPGAWSLGEALHHLVTAEGFGGRLSTVTLKRAVALGPLAPYPQASGAFGWNPPTLDDRWAVGVPEPAAPAHHQPIAALQEAMIARAQLTEAVLQRLAEIDPRSVTAPHPIIGDMNLAQWCRFAGYHMRVHLRQMQDIRAAPGFPDDDPHISASAPE